MILSNTLDLLHFTKLYFVQAEPVRFKNALSKVILIFVQKDTRCALSSERALWIFEDQQVDGLLTHRMGDISQTSERVHAVLDWALS
jgi:hypothetical protein